jgi:hypothetical protein
LAKSGYRPDMKVSKEKLYLLGYPLEFIILKMVIWNFWDLVNLS